MTNSLKNPPYYDGYIARVKGDVFEQLCSQQASTANYLKALPDSLWSYRYAPDKWTLWQSWRHVVDTERIMASRALSIMRGDTSTLPGYDQDAYAKTYPDTGDANELIAEFKYLRESNLYLFSKASQAQLAMTGTVSDNPMSVASLLYILAGHEAHHVALTKERYVG